METTVNKAPAFPSAEQTQRDTPETAAAPPGIPGLRPIVTLLFLVAIGYQAVPAIDLPGVGLSLSAVLFAVVALEVFARPHNGLRLRPFTGWITVSYLLWMTWLLSIGVNLYSGIEISLSNIFNIVAYSYWLVVFVMTTMLGSDDKMLRKMVIALGIGAIILAVARLGEGVIYQNWNREADTELFNPNTYGILFSSMTPFMLILPFLLRGWKTIISIVGVIIMLVAIVVTGSRSSWIAVALSAGLFFTLYFFSQRQITSRFKFVPLLVVAALALMLLPNSILSGFTVRLATLSDINNDNDYIFRLVMQQRALRLLEEHPLFGVGLGNFTVAGSVDLTIPDRLSHLSLEDFAERSSHNAYLGYLAQTGLISSIIFALLLAVLALRGLQAAFYLAKRGEIWAIAAYAAFVGNSIHLWALAGLGTTGTWLLYGLVAALIHRHAWLRQQEVAALTFQLPHQRPL